MVNTKKVAIIGGSGNATPRRIAHTTSQQNQKIILLPTTEKVLSEEDHKTIRKFLNNSKRRGQLLRNLKPYQVKICLMNPKDFMQAARSIKLKNSKLSASQRKLIKSYVAYMFKENMLKFYESNLYL